MKNRIGTALPRGAARAFLAAVVVLPLAGPTAWFDHWPSWGLYAANAERTDNLRRGDLYVSQAFVDQGVTLRRIRPRARGSASRILKRSSHITVVVEPRTEPAASGQASTRSKEK